MEVSPYLLIRKVVVKGVTSNYEAEFKEGLNIIWGDMDCGKSSILSIIDYCLGGSNETLLYEEMLAKGRSAQLEVDLNGNICTFERSIADNEGAIRVFMCEIGSEHENFPMLMSGHPQKMMPDGWVSDFILDALGIAKVSIRESKVRDDSSSDRLSFRDLMKLLYLKQTKVGADSLLNFGSPALFNKNVEIQKFVFNIHDDRITELYKDLTNESADLKSLKSTQQAVSKFLSDIEIPVTDFNAEDDLLTGKEEELEELSESSIALKKDYKFATDLALSMATQIATLKNQVEVNNRAIEENLKKYRSFSSLKSTYINDLECLRISKVTRANVSLELISEHTLSCPLCSQEVSLAAEYLDDDVIDAEIKSIRNRISGLQGMLESIWEQNQGLEKEEAGINDILKDVSVRFDRLNIENISALLASIEAIERQKVEVRVVIARLKRDSAINNKYDDISQKIENKELVLSRLKQSISLAEGKLLGLDGIVDKLSGIFRLYVRKSGMQNLRDIYLDKRFIPHFRGMSYYSTSSGGVRTITSILSFAARLKYLLKYPGNLPTFLMIDTPGQNIGRNVRDDEESGLSDPVLYENLFRQFIRLTAYAERHNRKCQIIVVDNDLPNFLVDSAGYHLVKRFSKRGGKFDKGLISDY